MSKDLLIHCSVSGKHEDKISEVKVKCGRILNQLFHVIYHDEDGVTCKNCLKVIKADKKKETPDDN